MSAKVCGPIFFSPDGRIVVGQVAFAFTAKEFESGKTHSHKKAA
jgi:hypothetical protein